jgi:predicted transcriptional regulator
MKTRVGIMPWKKYKARVEAIARGTHNPSNGEPKIWFQSLETMAQVLSTKNRELLALIRKSRPESLAKLAEISGRAVPNLSRTLRTMERYGLVQLDETPDKRSGRARIQPRVLVDELELRLSV